MRNFCRHLILGFFCSVGLGAVEAEPSYWNLIARQALLLPIIEAGGWERVADRLAPWRDEVARRIANVPAARGGGGYIAADGPIDGGDGWILSARRAKQLLYESDFSSQAFEKSLGDRRYRLAEESLLSLHQQCTERGIRLIVVPAPDKSDVYPDRLALLPEGVPTVNLKSWQLYLRLLHNGVEVVPLESFFRERRGLEADTLWMQRDTHWSPVGARLAALAVAERLPHFRGQRQDFIERPQQTMTWDGDLAQNWVRSGQEPFPKERKQLIGVATQKGKPIPARDNQSIWIIGDSYSCYPYNGYFSFWSYLSTALQTEVSRKDRAGGGVLVVRDFLRVPEKKRRDIKVLVLLFTNCSFFEVDFPTIDLIKGKPSAANLEVVAQVEWSAALPVFDPATADYQHADVVVPATIDRGDGVSRPIQLVMPLLRQRQAQTIPPTGRHQMLLRSTEPAKQPSGRMRFEVAPDPSVPQWWFVQTIDP